MKNVPPIGDCIELAYNSMVRILFTPFRLMYWLKLGFIVFLFSLLSGQGGGCNFRVPDFFRFNKTTPHTSSGIIGRTHSTPTSYHYSPSGTESDEQEDFTEDDDWKFDDDETVPTESVDESGDFEEDVFFESGDEVPVEIVDGGAGRYRESFEEIKAEFNDMLQVIEEETGLTPDMLLAIVLGGFIVVILIIIGCKYLSSRATFMFVDSLAIRDDISIRVRWRLAGKPGRSFFLFKLVLLLLSFLLQIVFLVLMVGMVFYIWVNLSRDSIESLSLIILVFGIISVIFLIAYVLISPIILALNSFMPLYMYKTGAGALEAFKRVFRLSLERYKACFIFFLLNIVINILFAIFAIVLTCATCCIIMIPYIRTVALLPGYVFIQYFAMYYAIDFGDDFNVFPLVTSPEENTAPADETYFAEEVKEKLEYQKDISGDYAK